MYLVKTDPILTQMADTHSMDESKVIAFLDIGTNSVRLLIISISKDRSWKVLARHKSVVRLGEREFERHIIVPEAIERGSEAIVRFVEVARNFSAEEIFAVATSASREAENRDEFINRVYDLTGVKVHVISGEDEARLIWLGVSRGIRLGLEKALFIDIGGGSTEVIVGDQYEPIFLKSLELGAIRMTNTFFPDDITGIVSQGSLIDLKSHIEAKTLHITKHLTKLSFTRVFGSSGTIIALESIAREHPSLAGRHEPENLTSCELGILIEYLCSLSLEGRRRVPGLNPDRADIIIPGALILQKLLNISGFSKITLSRRGLRDGLMEEYLSKNCEIAVPDMVQIRGQSVRSLGTAFHINEKHAHHVMTLAIRLFDSSKEAGLHVLSYSARELLIHAAYLHDIGHIISFKRHHHHSYYLIANASLPGFNQEEIRLIGLITRYHRKRLPRGKDLPYMHPHREDQRIVQVLAQILRVAENLDHSHDMRVDSARFVRSSANRVSLKIITNRNCSAEWDASLKERGFFEKTFDLPLLLTIADDGGNSENWSLESDRSIRMTRDRQDHLALGIRV